MRRVIALLGILVLLGLAGLLLYEVWVHHWQASGSLDSDIVSLQPDEKIASGTA